VIANNSAGLKTHLLPLFLPVLSRYWLGCRPQGSKFFPNTSNQYATWRCPGKRPPADRSGAPTVADSTWKWR